VHWWCDACHAGPYRFSHADPAGTPMKTPYGQRQYNSADGIVAGIRRWCSAKCAIAEERLYLITLLEKAQARRDLETVRVVSGRLHELSQSHPPQIPTTTERQQRIPTRAASLLAALEDAEESTE
jgi:hypothetical protein